MRTAALALGALLLTACDTFAEPEGVVRLGDISLDRELPALEANVREDRIELAITTSGNAGCTSHHDDVVHVDRVAHRISVRPYDFHAYGVCLDVIEAIAHDVSVGPLPPGLWLVRVIGANGWRSRDELVVEAEVSIPGD
ncbi:MAG TPA: hypothetical protein VF039_06420 [Longimicrobiales bacterium]